MSDVKKLMLGIVLVFISLFMLLSSGGIWPFLGGVLGVAGAILIIYALTKGHL